MVDGGCSAHRRESVSGLIREPFSVADLDPYRCPVGPEIDDLPAGVEAKVGVQAGTEGTNTFLVTLDGEVAFDSGPVITDDAPKLVKVFLGQGRDRTVLRPKLPGIAFGFAVDDVLENGCVYVRDAGLLVSSVPAGAGMAACRRSIEVRKTLLEQARQMPDQEFGKAVAGLYVPAQDRSPAMLSLARDNCTVIVRRNGEIGFGPTYTRSLDNGWMPIPRTTVDEDGIVHEQAAYVALFSREPAPADSPWCHNSRPVADGAWVPLYPMPLPEARRLRRVRRTWE